MDEVAAHKRFLRSREWQERLRPHHLMREPLCRFCLALGDVTAKDVQVDHIVRPNGDPVLQRDPENFQTLCPTHHAAKSQYERGDCSRPLIIGFNADGWPVSWTPTAGFDG